MKNVLITIVSIYLLSAFVTWNFNPGEWHESVRFVAVLAAAFFCPVVFLESK